jgi:hypothetical protein
VTETSSKDRDWAVFESELESLAAEAVHILGIASEIERLGPTLFEQVEVCDAFAARSIGSLFAPTALPLANALIHYAAAPKNLDRARGWSHERWPDQHDPTRMLAALTLVHIIELGWKAFQNDPDRQEIWQRIHDRLATMIPAEPRVAAVA